MGPPLIWSIQVFQIFLTATFPDWVQRWSDGVGTGADASARAGAGTSGGGTTGAVVAVEPGIACFDLRSLQPAICGHRRSKESSGEMPFLIFYESSVQAAI